MSIIVREKIDPHAVIVDTNILFDQDKSNVVAHRFNEFWDLNAEESNLQLLIPEVVIGEILFQQTNSALKTLSRANESFDRLASFTGKEYSHRVSESRIRNEVRQRLLSWASSKGYEKIPTPVEKIDWNRIIDKAIWRKPPFEFDPKKEDGEKGFRDAMILESVISYCETETDKKIVFITNDELLRNCAEESIGNDQNFSAFESIDDFEAYLRLEKESLEQSFIKSVINKATSKFFKYKDKNSLVYRADLISLIKDKYSKLFENPHSLLPDDFESGLYSDETWKPSSRGMYGISSKPQFQRIEGDNTFVWLSKVRFQQNFEAEIELIDNHIFVFELYFDVFWKANISVNERFTKMEIINIDHTDSKFTPKND